VRSRRAPASIGNDVDTATILRRGVLALAGLGIAGTVIELIFLRHWTTATAAIVWVGIVALGAAFVTLLGNPTAGRVRAVRILAAVGLVVAVVGIWFHVIENLDAGPLDRAFASRWDTMSALDQWWTAITGGVGPAPTLAPGAIGVAACFPSLADIRRCFRFTASTRSLADIAQMTTGQTIARPEQTFNLRFVTILANDSLALDLKRRKKCRTTLPA